MNIFKSKARLWSVLFASLTTSLSLIMHGFGLGYPSPIAKEITRSGRLNDNTFPVFVAVYTFGAAIGPFLSLPFISLLGRKTMIQLRSILSTVGWIMIIMGDSPYVLIGGRCLTGIGSGMVMVLTPIYVGEITEASTRGIFTSLFPLSVLLGITIVYGAGIFLSYTWLAVIPLVFQLMITISLIFQPYSPVWLAQRGLKYSTRHTLKYLRGNKYDIDKEQSMIESVVESNRQLSFKEQILYFRQWHVLKSISLMLILMAFAELTGIDTIIAYTSAILSTNSILQPNIAAFITILVQYVAMLIHLLLIDRLGRKLLLYLAAIFVLLGYTNLSVYSYFTTYIYSECSLGTNQEIVSDGSCIPSNSLTDLCNGLSIIPIVGIMLLRCSVSLGWGSVIWTLLGEIFPLKVKPIAASLSVFILNTVSGLQTLIYPFYTDLAGSTIVFLSIAIVHVFAVIFVIFFVPETKGKTIVEIENLFKRSYFILKEHK